MLNYYEILGVPRNADLLTIKSAFKKLALKYHPDRNPGNLAAEDFFKQVNEAYQVLSNEERKRRYDFILNYSYQNTATQPPPTYTYQKPPRPKPKQERSVYDRYGKFSWRTAPKYKKAKTYKIDKDYFKLQAFTLAAMVVVSLLILAGNKYWEHLENQKRQEIEAKNQAALNEAQTLYESGDYRDAINLITQLDEQNPFESDFYQEKERMVSSLFRSASQNFNSHLYKEAASKLEVVKDFERPMKMKTWEMLADAYYQLGEFKESVIALDHMLERDKSNIRLAVKIARMLHHDIGNKEKALEYYDEAKLIFKEFQSSTYGNAFELVVDPSLLPDFYYDLFIERANLNFNVGNYEEALTDCNWAIFMRPNIAATYNMRAHCKRYSGLLARACKDWQRAIDRGHTESREDLNKYCQ